MAGLRPRAGLAAAPRGGYGLSAICLFDSPVTGLTAPLTAVMGTWVFGPGPVTPERGVGLQQRRLESWHLALPLPCHSQSSPHFRLRSPGRKHRDSTASVEPGEAGQLGPRLYPQATWGLAVGADLIAVKEEAVTSGRGLLCSSTVRSPGWACCAAGTVPAQVNESSGLGAWQSERPGFESVFFLSFSFPHLLDGENMRVK